MARDTCHICRRYVVARFDLGKPFSESAVATGAVSTRRVSRVVNRPGSCRRTIGTCMKPLERRSGGERVLVHTDPLHVFLVASATAARDACVNHGGSRRWRHESAAWQGADCCHRHQATWLATCVARLAGGGCRYVRICARRCAAWHGDNLSHTEEAATGNTVGVASCARLRQPDVAEQAAAKGGCIANGCWDTCARTHVAAFATQGARVDMVRH